MAAAKIAISLDRQLLTLVDRWVTQGRYASRSQAIQMSLREKVDRWRRVRLAQELRNLSRREERALTEERFAGEEWPEY